MKKTEERRNRSASDAEVEAEREKIRQREESKKMKKEGERREIVIFKIDTRQRRVERAASRGWFREG